jgi:RNA polymerase sigma-70 factor (ECF subfamily)
LQPATVTVTEVFRADDPGLIRRARQGDAHAFDAIAASRLAAAYRLASAILGSEADAADATQNALVAAWRELPRLRDVERFDAWFHRILVNECRMQVRRRQARLREVDLDGADAASLEAVGGRETSGFGMVEALDVLESAFDRLDADDRTMVVLHHLEDRPLAEIAALLHMPVGTVKWRLHEARQTLYGALETVE